MLTHHIKNHNHSGYQTKLWHNATMEKTCSLFVVSPNEKTSHHTRNLKERTTQHKWKTQRCLINTLKQSHLELQTIIDKWNKPIITRETQTVRIVTSVQNDQWLIPIFALLWHEAFFARWMRHPITENTPNETTQMNSTIRNKTTRLVNMRSNKRKTNKLVVCPRHATHCWTPTRILTDPPI